MHLQILDSIIVDLHEWMMLVMIIFLHFLFYLFTMCQISFVDLIRSFFNDNPELRPPFSREKTTHM